MTARAILFFLLFTITSYGQFSNLKYRDLPTEQEYYESTFVPASNAANLQTILDANGSVRLGAGDYSASGSITISSNQKLYGWFDITELGGTLTIAAGATNFHVEKISCSTNDIVFASGAEISNGYFKNIRDIRFKSTGGSLESINFVDLQRCRPLFDMSASGYIRNCAFIKMTTQNAWPQTQFLGNTTDDSYGNVELWRNYLFPNGDGGEYTNLLDHTILGVDAESWNSNGDATKGLIYVRNVGRFDFMATNGYQGPTRPDYIGLDIQADNFRMYGSRFDDEDATPSIVRDGTNMITLSSRYDVPTVEVPANSTVLNGMKHLDGVLEVNGIDTPSIFGATRDTLKKMLSTPILYRLENQERPFIPLPVSLNWKQERIGKPSDHLEIQALIDSDNIAELEERVYYISEPLNIEGGEGVIGKGLSKTIIIGITDDFPLFQHLADTSTGVIQGVEYTMSHMTLLGGSAGLYVTHTGENNLQQTFCNFEYIAFREQAVGMHWDQIYGFDNNFLDNVYFIDCGIGFFQDPDPNYSGGDTPIMAYIDKTVFFQCKFINCGTGLSLVAARPNNSNGWIDCYFYNNDTPVFQNNNWNNVFIDSHFEYTTGEDVIAGNNLELTSFYGCRFNNNDVEELIHGKIVHIENSVLEDNVPILETGANRQLLVTNSEVAGTLGDVDDGIISNSIFIGNEALNGPLVRITDQQPTTIINGAEFSEIVNQYNFFISSDGFTTADVQTFDNALPSGTFPTVFNAIADGQVDGRFNRRDTNGPSGSLIVGPQQPGNFFAYTEGSSAANNSVEQSFRFSMLAPKSYKRENGLSLTAKVSLTRYTEHDAKVRVYHRPVGGDNTDWILGSTGPNTLGGSTFVWQDWNAKDFLGPGEPVELLFTFESGTTTAVWPAKAFFDNGIDNIQIVETEYDITGTAIFEDDFENGVSVWNANGEYNAGGETNATSSIQTDARNISPTHVLRMRADDIATPSFSQTNNFRYDTFDTENDVVFKYSIFMPQIIDHENNFNSFTNHWQVKGSTIDNTTRNDPFWIIGIDNRGGKNVGNPNYLTLSYLGQFWPEFGIAQYEVDEIVQTNIELNTWHEITIRYKKDPINGQIQVYQNGVLTHNVQNVNTDPTNLVPNLFSSVNNYGSGTISKDSGGASTGLGYSDILVDNFGIYEYAGDGSEIPTSTEAEVVTNLIAENAAKKGSSSTTTSGLNTVGTVTMIADDTAPQNGTHSIKLTADAVSYGTRMFEGVVNLDPSQEYVFAGYMKANAPNHLINIRGIYLDQAEDIEITVPNDGEWHYFEETVNTDESDVQIRYHVMLETSGASIGDSIEIDNLRFGIRSN